METVECIGQAPTHEWMDTPTYDRPVTRGQWQKTSRWLRVFFFAMPHRRRIWTRRADNVVHHAWEYDDCTIMARESLQQRFDPDVPRQQGNLTATEVAARCNGHVFGRVR